MSHRERQFPPRCPACARLLAVHAKRHCGTRSTKTCPWMTCECGANIAEAAS
jgi:hypothetical protein